MRYPRRAPPGETRAARDVRRRAALGGSLGDHWGITGGSPVFAAPTLAFDGRRPVGDHAGAGARALIERGDCLRHGRGFRRLQRQPDTALECIAVAVVCDALALAVRVDLERLLGDAGRSE